MANSLRVFILLLTLGSIVFVTVNLDKFDLETIELWLISYDSLAPLLFIIIFAVGATLFFPAVTFTLAGGALFGPIIGVLLGLAGATLAATLSFLISRYLIADWVENKIKGRMKQLKTSVENQGWRIVFVSRLIPLIPFGPLNYSLAITNIKLTHYVLASFVGMIPVVAIYTYVGHTCQETMFSNQGPNLEILLALVLIALTYVVPRMVRRTKEKNDSISDFYQYKL